MKRKLIMLMCLLAVSGCAIEPQQRLYDSKLAFLGTISTINVLKEAGRFDTREIDQIRAFANAGNEILKQWEKDGAATPDILATFETILEELVEYEAKGSER